MATVGLIALQASGYALGPVGALAAGIAASYIDSRFIMPALFPPDPYNGPRVGELGIQGADQGSPMNVCYGGKIIRVPCTIIWKSPMIHETETVGGKGSNTPESSTDHVFWHLDLAICDNEITTVTHLLADGKAFYVASNSVSMTAIDITCSIHYQVVPRRSGYSALTDDAVVVIGDTTVHMDGLFTRPGTDTFEDGLSWRLGEMFTVSGQQYHVVSVANWDGNDGDVTFWPPAQAAWADNTVVAFSGYAADKTVQVLSTVDPTGTLLDGNFAGYDVTVSGFTSAANNGTHYLFALVGQHQLNIFGDDLAQPEAPGDTVTIAQDRPSFFGDVVGAVTIYDGDSDAQLPDPLVETFETVVPSYRGHAHAVLEHFAGKPYGNRIPNFEACVFVKISQTMGDVLADLLTRAGFDSSEYQTYLCDGIPCHGFYSSGPQSPGQLAQTLMLIYDIVVQDREGVLTFLPRADVEIFPIRTEDLGAAASDEAPADPVRVSDTADDELDQQVNFGYQRLNEVGSLVFKPTHGEAVAKRAIHSSVSITKIDATATMSSTEARAAAERILWAGHANRSNLQIELPPSYITLRGSDLVQLTAHGDGWDVLLLSAECGENFRIHCDGAREIQDALTLTGADDGSGSSGDDQGTPPGAVLHTVDVAPLQSSEEETLGWYASVASGDPDAQWRGAGIYISRDGGTTYGLFATVSAETTLGFALTKLASMPAGTQDLVSTVDVYLYEGTSSSKTYLEVCNGSNWWLIGGEVVGQITAAVIGTNSYRFSRLLRGLRGTESQVDQHFIGEPVTLLSGMPLLFEDINIGDVGVEVLLKIIPAGGAIADYPAQSFTPLGATMRTFAPCSVKGSRNDTGGGWAAGDILITWIPRSRGLVRILSAAGAPELEPVREFELDIRNGSGTIVRTISVTGATSVVYLASQQTTDGLTPGALVDVEIAQVSQTLGSRGRSSRQTI